MNSHAYICYKYMYHTQKKALYDHYINLKRITDN